MTTDTVKDIRAIGRGCGSPAAVSDGGNSNAGSSPLALLMPLVNAGRHGPPATMLRRPQWPFQRGSPPATPLMSGPARMLRGRVEGARRRSPAIGHGERVLATAGSGSA